MHCCLFRHLREIRLGVLTRDAMYIKQIDKINFSQKYSQFRLLIFDLPYNCSITHFITVQIFQFQVSYLTICYEKCLYLHLDYNQLTAFLIPKSYLNLSKSVPKITSFPPYYYSRPVFLPDSYFSLTENFPKSRDISSGIRKKLCTEHIQNK